MIRRIKNMTRVEYDQILSVAKWTREKFPFPEIYSADSIIDFAASNCGSEDVLVLVEESEGRIEEYLLAAIYKDFDSTTSCALIEVISLPGKRDRNSDVLDKMETWAAERGALRITAMTKAPRSMWEPRGFKEVATYVFKPLIHKLN